MTIEKVLTDSVLDLVPHWYEAEYGPQEYDLSVGLFRRRFFTHRPLTPLLEGFRDAANASFHAWQATFAGRTPPSLIAMVQESLVLHWLNESSSQVDWRNLLSYVDRLVRRTYENFPVVHNIVISDGTGTTPLMDPLIQKFFDPLASSPRTFIRVDRQLRLMHYEQIPNSRIQDAASYKFYPSFLHPIASNLQRGEYSAHLTTKGDLVILDATGLLAAKRKGKWKIYDVQTFKDSIVDVLGDYTVGCNIFQLVFDLSFRRHGGLLIFDPNHVSIPHIANPESVIFGTRDQPGPGQSALCSILSGIALGSDSIANIPELILHELASIDGAVVFDKSELLAVGAVIQPHPKASGHVGARSTAAHSAYHWGAHPVKVSSDGDITLLFTSRNAEQQTCDARIEFL